MEAHRQAVPVVQAVQVVRGPQVVQAARAPKVALVVRVPKVVQVVQAPKAVQVVQVPTVVPVVQAPKVVPVVPAAEESRVVMDPLVKATPFAKTVLALRCNVSTIANVSAERFASRTDVSSVVWMLIVVRVDCVSTISAALAAKMTQAVATAKHALRGSVLM